MKTDRVTGLLTISIVLTIICGGIKYYNSVQKKITMEWVMHTYVVIHETSGLLTQLLEAQAGQRNFMFTGDSTYLRTYYASLDTLAHKLREINTLTADNPNQTTLIARRIRPLTAQRTAELDHTLGTFRLDGRSAALLEIEHQSHTMDTLRASLDTFRLREENLLSQRNARLRRIYLVNDTVNYACLVLVCIVSGIALKSLREKDGRNLELTRSLREANDTLVQRVQDRTLELERKNELAIKLNRDLQQNFQELGSFYEALQISRDNTEGTLREVRDLYDYAPCGYHSLDNNGVVVRINATACRWLGYTRDEVVGKLTIHDVTTPYGQQIYDEYFPILVRDGIIRNIETEFRRKDGSSFPALLSSTAIYDNNGQYQTNRSVVIDITERRALERKLLDANADLTALNEEKNHLVAIASHDLKSPLNGVLGLVNLLKMDKQLLNADQLQYIELMEQSCINMQMLINNLLDINRIEQGKNLINKELIGIDALLTKQLEIFKETADRKNIALLLHNEVPNLDLHTDGHALSRILENLISNAIKFSPANKSVKIMVIQNDTHVCFKVLDDGPGISPDDREKMFGKFQRLSARPTGGESSSGLGLSIVRELVNALDGRISVESEVNKGATFIVELPLAG